MKTTNVEMGRASGVKYITRNIEEESHARFHASLKYLKPNIAKYQLDTNPNFTIANVVNMFLCIVGTK